MTAGPERAVADEQRPTTADLQDLVSSVAGPMGAMLSTLSQGAVTIVQALLDRAYESGRARGRADAEYRVAHQVGVPTTSSNGVPGTMLRCHQCNGDGLVFRPDTPAGPVGTVHRPSTGPGETTTIIPRIRSEAENTQFNLDQLRRSGQQPPGR
jgi:hypothetical protein